MNNVDRKKRFLEYLVETRQMFIKLLVLVKWGSHAVEMQRCYNIVDSLREQNDVFRHVADTLHGVHLGLASVKYVFRFCLLVSSNVRSPGHRATMCLRQLMF